MKICPTCKRCYEDAETACSDLGHEPLKKDRPGPRLIADKYRLDRLLGDGAVGTVYQVTRLDSGRSMAAKFLKPEYFNKDPKAIERFRNEFQTGDLVGHQNIVRVYDYLELNVDETCIVMELIEGESLRDYIKRREIKQLPLDEAITIALQTALGIDALHRKHILHCDLKPENIMLTSDEQNQMLVKVVDFGLAKPLKTLALQPEDYGAHIKEFVGTILYTSPENCRGEELDERSDIYSLGIILYEMLTGRPPFYGRSIDVERQHRLDAPPPISTLRADIPHKLAELVMKTLNKDPKERPQEAKELASRLHFLLPKTENGPVSVAPPIVKPDTTPIETDNEQVKTTGSRRTQRKRDPSQRSKVQVNDSTEQPSETYINIPLMKNPKGGDRPPPLVLNRHELTFPSSNKNRILFALLAAALLIGLGIGACYLYKRNNGQAVTYVEQGLKHLEKSEFDKAIEAFSEAIRLEPNQFMPYFHRAVARYKKGDQEGAIQDYSEVTKLFPTHVPAYQQRASIYTSRGDYDKAVEDYGKVLNLTPNANVYKLRGDVFFMDKNYDRAIADYSEAIRLDSNNPNTFEARQAAYNKRGKKGDRQLGNADRKRAAQLRQ